MALLQLHPLPPTPVIQGEDQAVPFGCSCYWLGEGRCVCWDCPLLLGFFLSVDALGERRASRRGGWTSTFALGPFEQEKELEGCGRARGQSGAAPCSISVADDVWVFLGRSVDMRPLARTPPRRLPAREGTPAVSSCGWNAWEDGAWKRRNSSLNFPIRDICSCWGPHPGTPLQR